ncbi:MAG: DUF3987 domain-containing protein [Rhodobacteraceae bacterium]|nr:DUF3987 domain-containing protein [Paracoccaceae bacterium]
MTKIEPVPFHPEGPQPLVEPAPEALAYPVEALGPLRDVVESVQGLTQAPVAIPAQSALAAASLAVQGFADVETLDGPRPVSLYCLTIARSGERKSSCDAKLLSALRDHERTASKDHRAEAQSWRNAHALWQGEREKILAEAKKAKGEKRTAAQADLEGLGSEPAAPPVPDRTVTEPTFEGLTRKFVEGLPSLGIFSDEGGQFLGGHAMNSENRQKTVTALNDLWQGNPIRRTRQGDGSLTLYNRRLAMHLMVQPGLARPFLNDATAVESGFLARFLVCEPPSTIGTRLLNGKRPTPAGLDGFAARLGAILDTALPMDAETRELTPRTLPLSAEARDLLTRFANVTEMRQAPGEDLAELTGTASKVAEQAARIAGVLTLFRDLDAPEVTPDDMADAIELAGYYLSEALRLSRMAALSAELDRAERLRTWLLDTWPHDTITPREVQKNSALRTGPGARAALTLLERYGWIVPLPPGTEIRGAARKEAWRIVQSGGEE